MLKNLSKSVVSFLVISGVLGGAFIAIAVTPLVTSPPTTNDTVVNFDSLRVGYFVGNVDGRYETNPLGQTFLNHLFQVNPSPFTTDVVDGNLLPLRFGANIDSENAGLYSLGHYIGLMGKALQANGLFGRVGVEGRVTGPSGTARGFAGYLEYDPALTPTIENSVNIGALADNPGNNLFDDYIRISKGIPWAFYTENQSKFKSAVTIAGQLTAENEPLTFADLIGPVSNPVVEINPTLAGVDGNLIADTIYAEDFIATDDLSEQFFMAGASEDFAGKSDYQVFSATAFCSSDDNLTAIRLGCGGGLVGTQPAPTNTPYLGTKQVSNTGCISYARKPVGTVPGHLSSYAYCWDPK